MSFGDLAAIKLSRLSRDSIRKLIHEDFAVDFGRVHRRSPFQQQVALVGGAFKQQVKLAPYQRFLFPLADLPLDAHQVLAPALNFPWRNLLVQTVSRGAVLVRVAEGPHPVELCSAYKIAQLFEFLVGFAWKADDKRCP